MRSSKIGAVNADSKRVQVTTGLALQLPILNRLSLFAMVYCLSRWRHPVAESWPLSAPGFLLGNDGDAKGDREARRSPRSQARSERSSG
jgi:hypothetical protein